MWSSRETGERGENHAATYLKSKGYRILDRNYANTRGLRVGEIDIVAQKDEEIVFVEVKSVFLLPGDEERLPEWQVTASKLRKMAKIATLYLREHHLEERDYSFDVITVVFSSDKPPLLRHLDHVFLS